MIRRKPEGVAKEMNKRGFLPGVSRAVEDAVRKGGILIPAQKDTHAHPLLQGVMVEATRVVWLGENKNKKEVLKALDERAKEQKNVFGWGYAYEAGVTAEDLDEISKEGIVVAMDTAMHGAVVNTKMLGELHRRKKDGMKGKLQKDGKITEDFSFLAMQILEETFLDRAVDAVETWMTKRIQEGTTAVDEKIIFTKVGAEVLREAVERVKKKFGFSPVKSAFISHELFMKNPEVLEYVRGFVPRVGVKWVNDGGTRNATLKDLTFADGTKGDEHTIPINVADPAVVKDYIQRLLEYGVRDMAWHAIGDGTVKLLLDAAPAFISHGIDLEFQHFNIVDEICMRRAAELVGISISLQPNYSTEAFRPDYARNLGDLKEKMNAIRTIIELYEAEGRKDRITFGTDGMPQSMLFAIACAVNAGYDAQRIGIEDALYHAMDNTSILDAPIIVVPAETMDVLENMDMRAVVEDSMDNMAERLNSSVLMVANKKRILHRKE